MHMVTAAFCFLLELQALVSSGRFERGASILLKETGRRAARALEEMAALTPALWGGEVDTIGARCTSAATVAARG